MFNSIINTYELRETNMPGEHYTWSNKKVVPALDKLDMFLMSREWEGIFPLTTVDKLTREIWRYLIIVPLFGYHGRKLKNMDNSDLTKMAQR
jgi:hypothetical protein